MIDKINGFYSEKDNKNLFLDLKFSDTLDIYNALDVNEVFFDSVSEEKFHNIKEEFSNLENNLELKNVLYFKDRTSSYIDKPKNSYRGYFCKGLLPNEIDLYYIKVEKYNRFGEVLSEETLVLTNESINELYKNGLGSYIPSGEYQTIEKHYVENEYDKYLYKISRKNRTFSDLQASYENYKFKNVNLLNKGINLFMEMFLVTSNNGILLESHLSLLEYIYKFNDFLIFELSEGLYNKYFVSANIAIDIENDKSFNGEINRLKEVLELNGFKLKNVDTRWGICN